MPGRTLCVIAALLTQLTGGACLLLGTVAFALAMSNGEHGLAPILVGWALAALCSVISGSLVYRGNLVAMIVAALLDGLFGVVLLQIAPSLAGLLKMMSPDDISMVTGIVQGLAIGMLVAAVACVIAIPQGRKYAAAHELGADTPASTRLGFPAAAVPVTMMVRITPASRRRQWIAIAGLAIGVGSGVAVLASARHGATATAASGSGSATTKGAAKSAVAAATVVAGRAATGSAATSTNSGSASPGSAASAGSGSASVGSAASAAHPADAGPAIDTPQDLIVAELKAIGAGDAKALAQLAIDDVFAIGIAADEVGEGRAGVEAILARDLGKPPADGFAVDSRYLQIGEWRDHVWIAEELAIGARRFSITQLAAKVGNRWSVIAWHWAVPIPDAQAERLAASHTMPTPKSIADKHDGPDALDDAFRNALFSRQAFADSFAERDDGFNFGSAPGEHVVGGAVIKKLFGHINAQLRLVGGIHTSGGNQWDRSQASGAWIGFGAANVEFTQPRHATQTFRVLAILIRDDAGWQIVQTQFSNGG